MLRIIVITVRGIFLLGKSASKRCVGNQLFVQRLEKAGALQTQRLGDLLLEGLAAVIRSKASCASVMPPPEYMCCLP